MQKLSYSTNSVPGGTEASKDCPVFRAKDPISSLTHFIGFLMAIVATPAPSDSRGLRRCTASGADFHGGFHAEHGSAVRCQRILSRI